MSACGTRATVAVVGGGPAGLMAAEVLLAQGLDAVLYEARPSVGRKFLIAGRGGLNLTHTEPPAVFLDRYGARAGALRACLRAFDATAIVGWVHGLGLETFVGTSGRVFPRDFKAAPLLRAWVHRLRADGLRIHTRHRWTGFGAGSALRFETPEGEVSVEAHAVVLALGGASWPHLGSDGAWVDAVRAAGAGVAPLRPANCGFTAVWSPGFVERYAGHPLKSVVATVRDAAGVVHARPGEAVLTDYGIEGGVVYALSAHLRAAIEVAGEAVLFLDLAPGRSHERLATALAAPRQRRSFAKHLKDATGLAGAKAGLLREVIDPASTGDAGSLAATIKALPVRLTGTRPIGEAISTAGGVEFEALDEHFMLRTRPGVFCAGEMLDWEAPTGGYLLTGCLATGRAAAFGAARWLAHHRDEAATAPR